MILEGLISSSVGVLEIWVWNARGARDEDADQRRIIIEMMIKSTPIDKLTQERVNGGSVWAAVRIIWRTFRNC